MQPASMDGSRQWGADLLLAMWRRSPRQVSAHSRNKGRRGELEWAKYVGGKRDNDEGLGGHDVVSEPLGIAPGIEKWEVKRVKKLLRGLANWLDQATAEGADAVAFREDGGKWWVIVPAERLDR